MRQGIVGRFVGCFVGKSGRPDNDLSFATNDLDAHCRECRVLVVGERSEGLKARGAKDLRGREL
jgi:hypothetical protein